MYWFTGFFAKPLIERPATLPTGAVWRAISVPFEGVGVLVPDLTGNRPDQAAVTRLVRVIGLQSASRWLYLDYCTWAGRIDHVYGLGVRDGRPFGPTEESEDSNVETVYVALMREFGVQPADALRFPPFERGFWGDI